MKISKLFHWLYAILMLLPVFFIGGRVLYTIFNKNAKDSYSYIDENTNLSNANNLKENTYYYLNITSTTDVSFTTTKVNIISINSTRDAMITWYNENKNNIYAIKMDIRSLYFYDLNETQLTYWGLGNYNTVVYFEALENNTLTNTTNMSLLVVEDNKQTLDNAFSYSVSQLNENVLFSWAKDSFIVEPFRYITGLFGMPSDSPVLTLLSYWCSISLIWLTFDLLMYVPLLVHRWLDKGVLE